MLFAVMCTAVFIQFILSGRTLVWQGDGYLQHYPAYIYYGRYLRGVLHTIFVNHSFHIPQWDFSLGEGSDILQTLNYYVIGDPFTFFSFLFPSHLMYIYFSAMCIVRIYCAGLAFLYLCKEMGYSDKVPVLAGALMYSFSYWAFYTCARHPYFIKPMIWFPVIIVGIEKIIRGERPFIYILFVMIAAVSGFYFFYMIVFLVALYIVLRLFCLYKTDCKKIFKSIFFFLIYSCIALGLAAFLFMPTCYSFLQDLRTTHFQSFSLFYPFSYYSVLPLILLFPNSPYWLCMCFPVLSVASCLLILKEPKKHLFLLILLAICIIIILLPICGFALNGFSYVTNRWSWAFALLCSYTVVVTWEHLIKSFRSIIVLAIVLVAYSFSLNLKHQCAMMFYITFLVFFAFTVKQKKEIRSIIAFCLICLNVVLNANIRYHSYSKECMTPNDLVSVLSNETALIKKASSGDNDFFRYSGKNLLPNASINQNLSSVSFYWSLSNPYIMEYRKEMEISSYVMQFYYRDYDSRAALESLACVKYFYKQDESGEVIPYGFIPSDIKSVYKSDYALPLAYTYDSFMIHDIWASLNCVKKSEAILQTAVLEEPCDLIVESNPSFLSKNNPFSITKNSSSFSIKPEVQEPGELYVCLRNFRTEESESGRLPIHVRTSDGHDIVFIYIEPKNQWYAGIHDVSVNLGYTEKKIEKIDILFPEKRTLNVDDIQVISLPMTKFASLIKDRRKDIFDNMKIRTDMVEGEISLDRPKLLCFAIPFAKGWKATVDGKPTKLLRTNVMHMSVPLSAGEHKIVLTYHTPFLKFGVFVSLCSWVIFLFWFFRSRKKRLLLGQSVI